LQLAGSGAVGISRTKRAAPKTVIDSNAVKGLAYTDHGRNITLNTRDKFREWTEGWAKAFSDGRINNPQWGYLIVVQGRVGQFEKLKFLLP